MTSLLRAAGLPPDILQLIQGVVDTCKVCRLWAKPTDRPQASLRTSTDFNVALQVDLLFVDALVILHCICECIRWSAACILPGKTVSHILGGIVQIWFRMYGPPKVIISDHEGALLSEEASIWAERWSTSIRPKPVGSHAQIVERHHEIIRRAWHAIKSQCSSEGLVVSNEDMLAEVVFSKNAMIVVHGQTPYQALIGRTPSILAEFEVPGCSVISDDYGVHSRHVIRLREISIQNMIEGTAQERIKRAAATQARPSGELMNLKPGDMIDIYRQPKQKDLVGWRGPAEVISTHNISDGYVEAKWGGRSLSVRIPDCRKALAYPSFMDDPHPAMSVLRKHMLTVSDSFVVISMILNEYGWRLSKLAVQLPKIFQAALFVGSTVFNLRTCGCRIGHGVAILQGMSGITSAVLLWHLHGNPSQYRTLVHNGHNSTNLRQLFGDDWQSFRWIQFLSKEEGEPNGEVQPPELADVPVDDPPEDMEDDDVAMPLPSQPGSSMNTSSHNPMTTGTTRRESVNTGSSTASSGVWGRPPPRPPPPPAATRIARPKQPGTPGSSGSSPNPPQPPFQPPFPGKAAQPKFIPSTPQSSQRSRTPHPSILSTRCSSKVSFN